MVPNDADGLGTEVDLASKQSGKTTSQAAPQMRPDRTGVRDRSVGRLTRGWRFIRERGFFAVLELTQGYGARESLRFVLRNIRAVIAAKADRRFDRRYSVDTAGTIPLEFLDVVGSNREFGTEYIPTSPKSFAWMLGHVPAKLVDYVFLDLGAGKGRTLLLASDRPFAQAIGVEFASELVAAAKENLRSYRSRTQKCSRLEVVHADATAFTFPERPLLIYLYNPFRPEVLAQVIDNLSLSLRTRPRSCFIIYATSYLNTLEPAREVILGTRCFEEIQTRSMPFFFDAVRSLHFAVFSWRHETS